MFTGIIEQLGTISHISEKGGNRTFRISSPLTRSLKADQSLSHNGICLTVEVVQDEFYEVTAVSETLAKTTASTWKTGDYVNLERAMAMNARLDGHLVQGHVDTKGSVVDIVNFGESWEFHFEFPAKFAPLVIEKGSIAIDGVSLTAWNVSDHRFSVAIIPYTFKHTHFQFLSKDRQVNLEFDMIGKYINRLHSLGQLPATNA